MRTNTLDNQINDVNYVWNIFDKRPSSILLEGEFDINTSNIWLKNLIYSNSLFGATNIHHHLIGDDEYFISYDSTNDTILNIIIYFKSDKQTVVDVLIEKIQQYKKETIEERIFMVCFDEQLFLSPLELDDLPVEQDEDFMEELDEFVEKIDEHADIFSINGITGSGRTTILNFIINQTNRKVIYIPINMVETTFSNAQFHSILLEDAYSLVVIDDAENFANSLSKYMKQTVKGLQKNMDISFLLVCNNKIGNVLKINPLSVENVHYLCDKYGIAYNSSYKYMSDIFENKKQNEIGFN